MSALVNNVRNDGPALILPPATEDATRRPDAVLTGQAGSAALRPAPSPQSRGRAERVCRLRARVDRGGVGPHQRAESAVVGGIGRREDRGVGGATCRDGPARRDQQHEVGAREGRRVDRGRERVGGHVVGDDQDVEAR